MDYMYIKVTSPKKERVPAKRHMNAAGFMKKTIFFHQCKGSLLSENPLPLTFLLCHQALNLGMKTSWALLIICLPRQYGQNLIII
jgi:hypothetical protein